jgi:hypothetical protein
MPAIPKALKREWIQARSATHKALARTEDGVLSQPQTTRPPVSYKHVVSRIRNEELAAESNEIATRHSHDKAWKRSMEQVQQANPGVFIAHFSECEQ